jgi:hypothetical protein
VCSQEAIATNFKKSAHDTALAISSAYKLKVDQVARGMLTQAKNVNIQNLARSGNATASNVDVVKTIALLKNEQAQRSVEIAYIVAANLTILGKSTTQFGLFKLIP